MHTCSCLNSSHCTGSTEAVARVDGVPGARRGASGGTGDTQGGGTDSEMTMLFLSHGSPMQAIDPGEAGRAWVSLAASLPRPRAVLIASAHWETALPMLTGRETPETNHDFSGLPEPLYRERYARPGAPAVARRASELLQTAATPLRSTAVVASITARGCRSWMYRSATSRQLSIQTELAGASPDGRRGARAADRRRRARDRSGHHAQPARLVTAPRRWATARLCRAVLGLAA
jgi:hypothetical protein